MRQVSGQYNEPSREHILETVPCALEKKVYSAFGWNVLKISMRSILSNVSFKTYVSLLIVCFDELSIGVSGVLKSPSINVLLPIYPFMSVSFLSYVLRCSYVGCTGIYISYVFLLDLSLDHYIVPFLISCNTLYFKVYFV